MPKKIFITDPINASSQHEAPENLTTNYTLEKTDLLAYSEILKAVLFQYPEKLLFNLKEAAYALNVSVEFLRKKVSLGQINIVSLGDRKMISINELTRIITEGI